MGIRPEYRWRPCYRKSPQHATGVLKLAPVAGHAPEVGGEARLVRAEEALELVERYPCGAWLDIVQAIGVTFILRLWIERRIEGRI